MLIKKSGEFTWLQSQLRPFLRLHACSYLCIVLAGIFSLIDPLIVRLLIDDVIPYRRVRLLPLIALAFFLTYLGRLGFDSLGAMLNFRAVQKMTFRTRLKLLRHLQRLSAEYHDNRSLGDTLHRLQVDVDQIGTLSGEVIPSALRMLTVFSLVMTTMLVLNYKLTLIVIPLIPAFILIRRSFQLRLRQASDVVQERSATMISFLEEHLSAIVQVQLLSCEQREARRFARISGSALKAQLTRRVTELFFSSLLYLVIVFGMAAVLCYGGYQVIRSTLTAGGLVAFYGYTLQLFLPLYGVMDIYAKLQRVGASVRRVMEIAEADLVLKDQPDAVELNGGVPGTVVLSDVSFSYHQDRPVLEKVSMQVRAGERLALAGMSGNGKSTVARLIARLYDARTGSIKLDGTDVRDIKLKSLRSAIIFVPQDPVLFNVTLRENLLYGNPRASQEELETVSKLTQLENLIKRLPNGLDESLGPHGNRLSGGERQRVALARALLQHPKVLILDESTSALDEFTEKRLFNALNHFLKGVTTIVISHRPFPIQWANRSVHLNYGQIADEVQAEVVAWNGKQN